MERNDKSAISAERVVELFGVVSEAQLAELIETRKLILKGLEKILAKGELVSQSKLWRESKVHPLRLAKHKDLWVHLVEKTAREKIGEAAAKLAERGERVSAKRLMEVTGYGDNAVQRHRDLWAKYVVKAERKPKKKDLIKAACEKFAIAGEVITVGKVAEALGLSDWCIRCNGSILRQFEQYEEEELSVIRSRQGMRKRGRGTKVKTDSEALRESVEMVMAGDMCAANAEELKELHGLLVWYREVSPSHKDAAWVGKKLLEVAAELRSRNCKSVE